MHRTVAALACLSLVVLSTAARRCGARAGAYPSEADPLRAAPAGGRRGRPDRAHARRSPVRIDAPAGDRREPARRQWRPCGRTGHALDARRLHPVHGGRHQSGGQSQPLSQPRLRSVPRFHADQRHRQGHLVLVASSKVEANSVEELIAFGQGQSRQAQLRLDRARHPGASRHGVVQADDQDRDHPGVLSRDRAGHDRHRRRRRRRHVHRPALGDGAGGGRQGQDAGGCLAAALEP